MESHQKEFPYFTELQEQNPKNLDESYTDGRKMPKVFTNRQGRLERIVYDNQGPSFWHDINFHYERNDNLSLTIQNLPNLHEHERLFTTYSVQDKSESPVLVQRCYRVEGSQQTPSHAYLFQPKISREEWMNNRYEIRPEIDDEKKVKIILNDYNVEEFKYLYFKYNAGSKLFELDNEIRWNKSRRFRESLERLTARYFGTQNPVLMPEKLKSEILKL